MSRRLAPTSEKEARLLELVAANSQSPEHELFNGASGTMLAALHAYEATGHERWRGVWEESAAALWPARPSPGSRPVPG